MRERSNQDVRPGKVVLATIVCASAFTAMIPLGASTDNFEIFVFNGTVTQYRPLNGCTHDSAARAVAIYVAGTLVSIDIVADDGLVISTASNGGLFSTPPTSPWCSGGGGITVSAVTRSCGGNSFSADFLTGSTSISFAVAVGQCANNAAPVIGTPNNPTPVALILPGGIQGGPVIGCAGLVTLTLADGSTATVPAFGPDCSRDGLCEAYDGKPGVVSCVVAVFPPPQLVTEPPTTSTGIACIYNQPIGLDLNGDSIPEFSTTVKTVTLTPCP